MTRILLGQIGHNGDCLYATAIARQIKQDFPGCHLTWAVGSLSRRVLDHNPDIDELWSVPQARWTDMERTWNLFEFEAHELAEAGRFDHVFLTQIPPVRFANYDGTVRPSLFRNFPRQITVPVDVTINLTEEERGEVERWFAASRASEASQVVLCECSPKSGQSFMTLDLALQVAERVTQAMPRVVVVISTHEAVVSDNPRIVSAGALSIRQMAHLSHFVDVFLGCGSGITVAVTSSAGKQGLPTLQALRRSTSVYASFRHDFRYFGKPSGRFLEITTEDADHVAGVVRRTLEEGLATAQAEFDEPVPIEFGWYQYLITATTLERGRYLDAARSLLVTTDRFGWHEELKAFARRFVLPFVADDPRAALPHRREVIERLREGVARHGQVASSPD